MRSSWSCFFRLGPRVNDAPWLACVLLCFCAACTPPDISGLPPAHPEPEGSKVDSVLPTLRWEPFPRPLDLDGHTEGWLARIRSVTYDLRIWRTIQVPGARNEGFAYPGDLVYSRDGVREPIHTVETPLAPDTSYVWSIRARYELDGEVRVTEWSMLMSPNDPFAPRASSVPPRSYYRFRTP